jgi:putative tRNA adenosine deaminase-associated protein
VAYFAALLARSDDTWTVSESDLDDVDDMDDLAEGMRKASVDDEPVLLLIEQEDMWFGVVRVDGEDDPRIFVSDAAVASRSSYGDMLVTAATDVAAGSAEPDEGDAPDDDGDFRPSEPVGDAELLADLGTRGADLLALCSGGRMPTDALSAIAERAGCPDELESVR